MVSIIIPTYNRKELLTETIDSILKQDYKNWECIVVDDGGSDDTSIVMNGFSLRDSRIRYYKRPDELIKGANACRNYGFRLSKGDYIQWFDDDDIMLPGFLSKKVALFKPNLKLLITSGEVVDGSLNHKKFLNVFDTDNVYYDFVLGGLDVITPTVIFTREFLKGRALFNESLTKCQEMEFYSRLFFKLHRDDYDVQNISLYQYRMHEDSSSYKNQLSYNPIYKRSENYALAMNLKRAIELGDTDLIRSSYRMLINQFYRAVINKDEENLIYILEVIKQNLKAKNEKVVKVLILLSKLSFLSSFPKFRWDKVLKKVPVN